MARGNIRVLVVDDAPLIRELIVDVLARHPEIQVVGTAGNGEQALKLVAALQPDVVTLDLQMPKMDGFRADQLFNLDHEPAFSGQRDSSANVEVSDVPSVSDGLDFACQSEN